MFIVVLYDVCRKPALQGFNSQLKNENVTSGGPENLSHPGADAEGHLEHLWETNFSDSPDAPDSRGSKDMDKDSKVLTEPPNCLGPGPDALLWYWNEKWSQHGSAETCSRPGVLKMLHYSFNTCIHLGFKNVCRERDGPSRWE